MNNQFLKSNELTLNAANYLVSTVTNKPVTHPAFVAQQRAAEYTVKLAEAIKGKVFTDKKGEDLNAIILQVQASLQQQDRTYVDAPAKPKSKVLDDLIKYATDFSDYADKVDATENINKMMNKFNAITDIEAVGDYFTEGVVKLNRIYTIAEILAAVEVTVETLG